ncbi:hypothetical protein VNI00_010191 [Paramarasmius palmivorus]|uniref:Uncharacterized protein n=1 Tax=Paramarasmius palmivorus TaxID=297713 RepID=A0AAW0CLQ8_9AGAR
MPSRPSKKQASVLLSDDERSDSSVVFVKAGAGPKSKPVTKVATFGEITSDDEVVVVEKKRKPSISRSESTSPSKSARLSGTSTRAHPLEVPASPSPRVRDLTEVGILKSEGEDHRVYSLSCSPVTPPRKKGASFVESPTKRPQRTPRPTEKARDALSSTVDAVLMLTVAVPALSRLDRLSQRDETPERSDSDESYLPSRKGNSASRRSSGVRVAASAGVKKSTNSSSRIAALESAFQESELAATEDDLPSPSTVFNNSGRKKTSDNPDESRGRSAVTSLPRNFENRGSSVESVAGSPPDHASVAVPHKDVEPLRKFNRASSGCAEDTSSRKLRDRRADSPPEDTSKVVSRIDKGKQKAVSEEATDVLKRDSVEWDYEALANVESHASDVGQDLVESGDLGSSMDVDPPPAASGGQGGDEEEMYSLPPLLDADLVHPDLVKMYSSLEWLHRKLRRSMGFLSSPPVYNAVRQSMEGFVKGWNCLTLPPSEGSGNAIWILSGICVASHLTTPASYGDDRVKQIHIQPFENDWDIYQSNIGTFFDSELCQVPGRADAVVFSTKKQNYPQQKAKNDSAPKPGTSSLKSKPYSPAKGASSSALRKSKPSNVLHPRGPAFRLYDEGIPVYDGRSVPGTMGFKFDADAWQNYESLPRYPHSEVKLNSLVAVAHTIHGFLGDKATYHTVLLNALFVIVLGEVPLGEDGAESE